MVVDELSVGPVVLETALLFPEKIVRTVVGSESPLSANNDLLATRELELGTTERLASVLVVLVLAADGEQNLTDAHTGACALGLAESTAHTGLKPISTGARKHLVDTEHVERMHAHTQVEGFLSGVLDHVLVARNTRSLKGLAGHIFLLPTDEMYAERENLHAVPLHTAVIDADLGIRDTAAEAGLGVGLILDLAVATRRTSTHLCRSCAVGG